MTIRDMPADIERSLAGCMRGAHQAAQSVEPPRGQWARLVHRACDEWVGGILFQAVERNGWGIPDALSNQLRWQAQSVRRGNRRLLERLASIVRAFRCAGVDVLLLKGAALNLTAYECPTLRPMTDLDLLIRPDDAEAADRVLGSVGFERGQSLMRSDFFPTFFYAAEYVNGDDRPVRVDLHGRPLRPLGYAQPELSSAFWEHARTIERNGTEYRVLADEEQLIHLTTHSACHGHERLLWLYDICRLIDTRGGGLDWTRVVDSAKRFGLALPVRQALQRVDRLWPTVVPQSVLTRLESVPVTWRERICLAQAPHDASRPIRHLAVDLLCARGVRLRCGYAWRYVFPGAGHLGERYSRRHRGWTWCAHAARWGGIMGRTAWTIVRSAAGVVRGPGPAVIVGRDGG